MENSSAWVNSLGLALDVVGVILIWRYGLPEHINRNGAQHLLLEGADESEQKKAARYDLLSRLGLLLLILGFGLQALSNFL